MLEFEANLTPRTNRYLLAAMIMFPVLYALLSLALGQDANWDLKNYHWYNGYAFATGRFGFDLLPSQTPYFYNPTLDAAFYLLASHIPAFAASFILSYIQALNFFLLFFLARRLVDETVRGRDAYALAVATMGMLGGGWLAELGTTFYDNIVSLGVFGSALLALRAFDSELRLDWRASWRDGKFWGLWILAGLPVGLATGIKLPTAIFCVGLCGACFILRGKPTERFARAFAFGLGVLLGIAITLGHWAFHLWQEYQNPLFPYFNNIFKSPVTLETSARDIQFVPQGWHKLVFPFEWLINPLKVGEVPFRDLKLPLLYLLLPLALLVRIALPRRAAPQLYADSLLKPEAAYVLATLILSYAAWLFIFAIYRYAVPLEALAALALLIAVDLLPLSLKAKRKALIVLAVICLAGTQVANWGRTAFTDKFVDVRLPPIEEPAETMVLMAGFQPYSHVVPSLPASMPVVRLQSNFASPGEPKGINRTIKMRIANWPGSFLLLLPTYDVPWVSREVLPQFGLKTMVASCKLVKPNFSEDLSLCPVVRVGGID